MMFMGMVPIGAMLAGLMASRIGAAATVAIGGSVCIVSGAVFWIRLPGLKMAQAALHETVLNLDIKNELESTGTPVISLAGKASKME
jgi:fucose permease